MKSLSRVEPLLEGGPLVFTDVEFCNPTVNIEMGDKYRPFPSFSVVHQVFDHVLLLHCKRLFRLCEVVYYQQIHVPYVVEVDRRSCSLGDL